MRTSCSPNWRAEASTIREPHLRPQKAFGGLSTVRFGNDRAAGEAPIRRPRCAACRMVRHNKLQVAEAQRFALTSLDRSRCAACRWSDKQAAVRTSARRRLTGGKPPGRAVHGTDSKPQSKWVARPTGASIQPAALCGLPLGDSKPQARALSARMSDLGPQKDRQARQCSAATRCERRALRS